MRWGKPASDEAKKEILHMCGVCTYLYPKESMHLFRHDEIADTIKGDGKGMVGNVQILMKTYKCNRCEQGLTPLPLGRNGQF